MLSNATDSQRASANTRRSRSLMTTGDRPNRPTIREPAADGYGDRLQRRQVPQRADLAGGFLQAVGGPGDQSECAPERPSTEKPLGSRRLRAAR